MSSLPYLNGEKEIDINRKRAGTISELRDLKTLKVRPSTYQRLLNVKKKLYQQSKGNRPSFDFVLNYIIDQSGVMVR